jgi:DNA-binding IclR family transcriptional regulator
MSSASSGRAGQRTSTSPAGGVAAVTKAAEILHSFTALSPVLSIRRLAERTSIPRSTVHGLCVALAEASLLESVPGRGYRLGPALVELGGQVIDRTGLVEAAEGVLERVPRRDGTEAHLGQLVDGWIVYLDRATGVIRAPMNNRVGLRVPAALTGCGRAALSQLEPEEALARVASAARAERWRTPSPEDLAADLHLGRTRGYVVTSHWQPGRVSVAAPVVDPGTGVPIGGVSIAGPSELFSASVVEATARNIVAAARTISTRLPPRR